MSVKECRLVVVELLENGAHERFPNETAAVGNIVFLAEQVQRTLFAFVEKNGYSIFARFLHLPIRNIVRI